MRFVEAGKGCGDPSDSLTRLSRAYNNLMPSSARVMTGGLRPAPQQAQTLLGAARNMKQAAASR